MSSPRPSVLVVDDIDANLAAIEAQLGTVECDIIRASSGNEALKQLLKREFAVMLLDVQMPIMDGYEVAMYARANPATRDVPIIFLTALHQTEEALLRGYGSGAVDFLFKPIDPYVLRSKVRVFLELYTSRKRLSDEIDAHRKTTAEMEASAVLIGALDVQASVEKLAGLLVPRLADWCTITMPELDASSSAMQLSGARMEAARDLERLHPPGTLRHWAVNEVVRSGRAQLYRRVPEELIRQQAADEHEQRLLSRIGITSVLVVPVPARGRTLGAMTLVSCDGVRRFDSEDLDLTEELGRRVGLAIDNALLHREAREAIIARDEFLALASHELRTPVTALQLQHQVLAGMVVSDDDPVKEKLKVAMRQTVRLEMLVQNLLDVSRILTDHMEMDRRRLDLAEIAQEALAQFEEQARRAGSELVLRVEGSVFGMWDALRLHQILTNLLSNALKFGQGKPVEVRIQAHEAFVTIEVTDHGIGIGDESVARIFEKFERAVSSAHFGGLGLGLYIVRRSVEALGGTISVASHPGQGSSFKIILPREPDTNRNATANANANANANAT